MSCQPCSGIVRVMARSPVVLAVAILLLGLVSPRGARAYEPRHVFITNRGGGNIVELDEGLTYTRTWFGGELLDGRALALPNGMAFTPEGALFVADTANSRVVAFDASGGFLRAFDTMPRLGMWIESIYFDAAGVLYASANPGSGVVARYTQTGADMGDVVSSPDFLNLGNINLTNVGTVLVSDFSGGNRGLRELDVATGAVVRTFGTDLMRQEDVMIDGADRIFVSHFGAAEVVVFGPAPMREELYRFTAPSSAPVRLEQPTGIALTHDCRILVASFVNRAVFVFRHNGPSEPTFERVLRAGEEIPTEAALSEIESIAISGLGLPGSFDEFADRVPSCDEPASIDAGPVLDTGRTPDAAAPAVADAASGLDAGRGRATPPGASCGCRAGRGDERRGVGLLGVGLLGLAALRGRRRQGSSRRGAQG
jgi:MYXO-CTERM domain-containing protein